MTFEDVMVLTRVTSNTASFEEPECRAYYDILSSLSPGVAILEIGLQFGRSSSIALQVAKARKLDYIGVDPFIDPPGALGAWVGLAQGIGHPFRLECCESQDAMMIPPLGCALVDGNHWKEYVERDAKKYGAKVEPGGYLLFHDFGSQQLPDVYPTVDANFVRGLMDQRNWFSPWRELPTVGCLGIFQRTA